MIKLNHLFLVFTLLMFSCANEKGEQITYRTTEKLLPAASGGYSDIVVITEKKVWKNGVKQVFTQVFSQELKGLYTPEHNYDLISIADQSFSNLFKKQRIIIRTSIRSNVPKPTIGFKEDKYAKNQLYISITANSKQALINAVEKQQASLLQTVNAFRLRGLSSAIVSARNNKVDTILKRINCTVKMPQDFSLVEQEDNFFYFGRKGMGSCESGRNSECQYQVGWSVYQFSIDENESFLKTSFVTLRDSLTKVYVVGEAGEKQPFMEIEKKFPLNIKDIYFSGKRAYEVRGWWNMVNATMGGPFLSYVVLDDKLKIGYLIDGFMFGPNLKKRKFLLELEVISKSLKFTN